ncbi:MAG: hypothetical protein HY866_03300 [Chloroflexi bacterium]|nr:hypothetical protein [Chloroflexota bacterium]
MIGGDIDASLGLSANLKMIDWVLFGPVYFVLGNHDYYHSAIDHINRTGQTVGQPSDSGQESIRQT